jgi:hypothetical protein
MRSVRKAAATLLREGNYEPLKNTLLCGLDQLMDSSKEDTLYQPNNVHMLTGTLTLRLQNEVPWMVGMKMQKVPYVYLLYTPTDSFSLCPTAPNACG